MNRILAGISFLFFSVAGYSQNLVINPSFETFTTCPLGPGSFGVQTWTQVYPSQGSPGSGCSTSDYYNACNTNGFADVPSNFLGNENALTGVAYVGIILFEVSTPTPCGPPKGSDFREYIHGTLSAPLIAGQTYSVSFNVSLPDDMMFASDDIGIHFSNTAISLACPPPLTSTVLGVTPQLQYTGPAVTSTSGWTMLQWIYTATGGEQFITIGNFNNDAASNGVCVNPSASSFNAYYYIDDVSVTISPPSSTLNTTASATNLLCSGQCTGTAVANPASGTAPYTFLWSNGQTTSAISALCAGNYSVLVTDAAAGTATATVSVTQPTAITTSTSVTPSACGGATGTASVSASGGSPAYSYTWSNGSTVQNISGLSTGNYSVLITDANGCTQTATTTITSLNGPSVVSTQTNASCSGVSNGTASAGTSGGTAPYTYSWSNGQSSSAVTGLAAGTYSVLVTDAGGCSASVSFTIINGSGPVITISPNVSISAGSTASLTASGGSTYSWSPSQGLSCSNCSNPVASSTITTQYCVQISDANGCTDSACVTVYLLPEPVACGEFYLPNAFSPNSDNENDVFKAYINPVCVSEFKLTIYNRWGEKVFETTDVTDSWNGEYRGIISDPAVYAYSCKVILTSGKEILRKGNVSLVR